MKKGADYSIYREKEKKRNRNLKTAGYKSTEACEVASLNRKETSLRATSLVWGKYFGGGK